MIRAAIFGRNPRHTLARIAALAAGAYIVFGHLLIPVRGAGPSMLPTLQDGQFLFVNTLAYVGTDPRRGDIVGISLAGRSALYIKRIVGLPGERLRIDAGTVYVDGVPLEEPYVERRRPWDIGEFVLGDDEYLVIGDNRGMTVNNHDFGKARRERIIGRVVRW